MDPSGPNWPQVDPKLVSSWPHVAPCWAKLNPSGAQVGPKLAYVGPSWSKLVQIGFKLAPRWSISPMLAHVGPKLAPCWPISQGVAKASTKALTRRPWFSNMSTKALPQAFRRLIVLSGCSVVLLLLLKVVSFWCFFQPALSWQVFQNDVFKHSSQVVLAGSSFWKFHPFSCIA